jgi:hypothetical protein
LPPRATRRAFPRSSAVERVVYTDELTARDWAAAILVIVFGQHIEDVIRLTWDNVTVADEVVTVRLGKTEFALPSPLDEPMPQLSAAPGKTKLGPMPIIADALGYHPSTIERHAIASASTYAEYVAAARQQRRNS